ncbi:Rraga [Symbiodinium sp. CCMP2592]|nr:Rraga [Symbiodinium sp. CCMP2592]
MPPPYPEAGRETGEPPVSRTRKRAMNSIVIALSFLHLRGSSQAPSELSVGRRLNFRQWAVVRRHERLLEAWLIHPQITPDNLGRNAEKMEEFDSILGALEAMLEDTFGTGSYNCRDGGGLKPGHEPPPDIVKLGKVKSNLGATFKKLDPDRIVFTGEPSFDPAPYLDRRGREIFLHPLRHALLPWECTVPLPAVQVHIAEGKREQFLELLDSSNRLALFRPEEVRLDHLSGGFAVGKDQQRDRLIVDARRPNTLEHPLGRWIKSLASGESLCRVVLLPDEKALNAFNMMIPEALCRHLRAYDPDRHGGARVLVPALNALAMGDTQAVEVAQTCHISLAWRSGALTPASTLTLTGPAPRASCFGGIVIDDFVCAEKVKIADHDKAVPSAGALAADKVSHKYIEEGLIPHTGKAFRDEPRATFWGTDIDGEAGLVRGSLTRAIPLMHVILRIVSARRATVSLLQAVAGSLVSLFIYKRRLLSLLSVIFSVVQHREADEVLQVDAELLDELMLCALLLPLAVTNIRASVLSEVFTTDASSWGEAEVSASIPAPIAYESVRHVLRKSVWTKLLGPLNARARLLDVLAPDEELPEGKQFHMHPLWEVRCPKYKLAWRQAYHWPESRALSSSLALNSLLKQSVATVIGGDVVSEGFYVNTTVNPSDDPTRGKEVRPPDLEFPSWWSSAAGGDFAAFDTWLSEAGYCLSAQLGIPDPSELLGPGSPEALPRTDGPADLRDSVSISPLGSAPQGSHEKCFSRSTVHSKRSEPERRWLSSIFSERAIRILQSFDSSLFVWPRDDQDRSGGLREWVFDRAGYLDLFSGSRRVSKVVSMTASTWALCLDLNDGPQSDLLDAELRGKVEELIREGVFSAVGASPACGSFSIAIVPSVRSVLYPQGLPQMRDSMGAKVLEGNSLSRILCGRGSGSSLNGQNFVLVMIAAFGTPPCAAEIAVPAARITFRCEVSAMQRYKKPWTKVAEAFPRHFAELLGAATSWHCLRPEDRLCSLDVAKCAKVSNLNIGEASHPGPRASSRFPRAPRNVSLDEVKLVSAQTEQLQSKIWGRFQNWVTTSTSIAASDAFLAEPLLLCILVSEFGRSLFYAGESLYLFRHLILAALKHCPRARQHVSECWTLVSKWELVEPLQHRAPLPEVILRAMVAVALLWGWERIAGILLIAFWGISRPGEALRSFRSDLLLPSDLLIKENRVCYLKISAPKTGRRTKARVQHISVHNSAVLPLLERIFKDLRPSELLFAGSPSSFRRRWDALIDALLVPRSLRLTPGGLRGGGAVAEYHRGTDLATIQWRMRIKHQVTLEAYLQEVAAENLLLKLPEPAVSRVTAAAAIYDLFFLQCSAGHLRVSG